MNNAIDLINFSAAVTGLVIVLLGLFFTLAMKSLESL